jgi:hypothetical protein
MADNRNAAEQQVVDISHLLLTVERALNDWTGGKAPEEMGAMAVFQRCVSRVYLRGTADTRGYREVEEQLGELVKIRNQSSIRNFALQENDKAKISRIFLCVDQARKRLMVSVFYRGKREDAHPILVLDCYDASNTPACSSSRH